MIPNFNKLPDNDFASLTNQKQAFERLTKVNDYLKIMFNCDHVFICDMHPLSTWFDKNNLDMNKFELSKKIGAIDSYKPIIKEFKGVRILDITLKDIAKHFDLSFCGGIVGYNGNNTDAICQEGNTFFNDRLEIIFYFFNDYTERLAEQVRSNDLHRIAWKQFEDIKLKMSAERLGQEFEILEPIYWHFLEVLPPIYGKGCFYCSEAYTHTNEGKVVYYCLSKAGSKYFISFDTVKS